MERALLVTVDLGRRSGWTASERAAELAQLARSAGAAVVREEIVKRTAPVSAHFIGSGKAEELAAIAADERIAVVIFNNDLTGTQQKNLETTIGVKTIDRTQLILDIFARRAHSNEGKVQVELAQLLYLLPRLTGKGIELSRLGGGIGTRGPGEQKLEVDRRRIWARVARLKRELADLSARRAMMRKKRSRFAISTIALVGYTNVGKSTLLNALTASKVMTEDKLFATLDPTVRRFVLPNKQKVLFIDTVGFLVDLPHHLIEAFKATLEEVVEADILIHLIDASHPKVNEQADAVYRVLKEIGAHDKTIITALNKADIVTNPLLLEKVRARYHEPVVISALQREGLDRLVATIGTHVAGLVTRMALTLPASDAGTLNLIYENGDVVRKEYDGDIVRIEAVVPVRLREMLERRQVP